MSNATWSSNSDLQILNPVIPLLYRVLFICFIYMLIYVTMHGLCFFIWFILNIYSGFSKMLGHFSTCLEIWVVRRHLSANHVISFPIFPLNQYFLDSKVLYTYKASFSLTNKRWMMNGQTHLCTSHLISPVEQVSLTSHGHTENNWPFARLPRLTDSAKGHEFLSLPRPPTGLLEYQAWDQERNKYLSS